MTPYWNLKFQVGLHFFLLWRKIRVKVGLQTTDGIHVSFFTGRSICFPCQHNGIWILLFPSISSLKFIFCSVYPLVSGYFIPSEICLFFPDMICFCYHIPPVVLCRTPIITAEDPYGFPERSILEDHRKNKTQPPASGRAIPEAASDHVQQAEDLALKKATAGIWHGCRHCCMCLRENF